MAQVGINKSKIGHLSDVPVLSVSNKKTELRDAFTEAMTPPDLLDLDEWSDRYRQLPSESSSEPGIWRTSRFPFLRRVMKCMSPTSIASEICAIKGCQLGFTELCTNWMLYIADRCPGPTMYVQKTLDAAHEFSKQRFQPNIEICERVKDKIGANGATDSAGMKSFPGGFIVLGGANSGAFLRSKPIANAMADEEDSFSLNIDGEGSPIGMIRMRQNNFPLSKFFRLSTPKYTETSTISVGYEAGSQEQYYLPCPECNPEATKEGTRWILKWGPDTFPYSDERDEMGEPVWVCAVCTHCGAEIHEHHKTWMLENGIWMSTKGPVVDGVVTRVDPYEVGDVGLPSFQISSLYSPLGFKSWGSCVKDFWQYKDSGDTGLLQTFVNQILGETFDLAGKDISYNGIMDRKEDYGADLPDKALYLSMGVDVQKDRLEAEILAHGLDGEVWSVDYLVLRGNPEYLGDNDGLDHRGAPTCWKLLDEYLDAKYYRKDGSYLNIECTFIDAGYNTDVVHLYCKFRHHIGVYPTKGINGFGKGLIQRPKRRHEEYGTIHPYSYVDELKTRIYSQLRIDVPGPGYCHFPDKAIYDTMYFKGLVMETLKVKMVGGKKVLSWDCPPGGRNEPLDVRNYAMAALFFAGPNLYHRARVLDEEDELPISDNRIVPVAATNAPGNITRPTHDKLLQARNTGQTLTQMRGKSRRGRKGRKLSSD